WNGPVHPRLEGFKLRKRGAGNKNQCGVAGMQTGRTGGDVVNQIRAARAAIVPGGIEHEMVDNQLAAPVEQVEQTRLAIWPFEGVFLLDLDHRQPASFSIELVPRTGGFLFFAEQLRASSEPFLP